jgi:hypothetical protein
MVSMSKGREPQPLVRRSLAEHVALGRDVLYGVHGR